MIDPLRRVPSPPMLCHKPDDKDAEPGIDCTCAACGTALVCTHKNADMLEVFTPICSECVRKGPEFWQEQMIGRN